MRRAETLLLRPVLALAAGLALASGCSREERRFKTIDTEREASVALSELHPGAVAPPPVKENPHAGNAHAIAEGRRMYVWFNCAGCHFNGGGGIGPPLMDDKWIYGNEPANVFHTILEGRPNGMPSFRGRLSEDQIWQIVAYIEQYGGRPLRSPSSNSLPRDARQPGQ